MFKVIKVKEHHRTKAARMMRKSNVDILERTRQLLSVPFGWNKGGVVGPAWESNYYKDENACSFNCMGALLRSYGEIKSDEDKFEISQSYIEKKILPLMGFGDYIDLAMFEGDQEDKLPVLALLDEAIIQASKLLSKFGEAANA